MSKLMKFDANVREVFDNDEAKYAAFNKLMLDTAKGTYEAGIDAKSANDKIVEIFRAAIGVSENDPAPVVRKAIKRNQQVIFNLIEDIVEDRLVSGLRDPFYNEYCEVKNIALGDQNIFTTKDNTILSVSRIADGHWDIDRQRLGANRTYSISTNTYGIGIYSEYERVLLGLEQFSDLVNKLNEAIDRFVNEAIYQAFVSAADELPGGSTGSGQWVKTGELNAMTKETFITLLEDVQMATGSDVMILGTKAALSKLEGMQDINWISSNMKEERYTTGRIGYFEGVRLVELKQGFVLNDTSKRLLDDKQLFIMPMNGDKFVKVVNEGDAEMKQTADMTVNQDQTYEMKYVFRFGVAVQIGLLFGVWKIAS